MRHIDARGGQAAAVIKLLAIRQRSSSIRLVLLQFLSFSAVGMIAPYINLYLTELEFSGVLIGTLASIGAILSLSLTPLLNQIADRLMLHRRLFMLYLAGFALANIIFATSRLQVLVIFAVLLIKITVSPSMTLGMQLTMSQLVQRGKAILGQIRSFAALGFTVASLLAGQLFLFGGYPLLFGAGAIFALLSIQMSTIFPPSPKNKAKRRAPPKTPRNRGFYVLVASQFFLMMGIHNSFYFMFIHFSQNLGIATAEIGLWAALLAAVEIPFFIMMDAILPKVRMRTAYLVGILGIAVFNFLLGAVQTLPALALLILFRGLVWPGFHLSSYTLVSQISHPHNAATNQAILQVTMPSIALLLTGSLFGWVFDTLGAGAFFTLCALTCFIAALIVAGGYRLFESRPTAPK